MKRAKEEKKERKRVEGQLQLHLECSRRCGKAHQLVYKYCALALKNIEFNLSFSQSSSSTLLSLAYTHNAPMEAESSQILKRELDEKKSIHKAMS
jgi:hypothetical protein